MCGKRFGRLADCGGGCERSVPHFGGRWCSQWPFDGNICLRVDHCSQRVEGAHTCMLFSSLARESNLIGGSDSGTQWLGNLWREGTGCSKNLCRCTGAILRLSSGLYHLYYGESIVQFCTYLTYLFTQTNSFQRSFWTLQDQKWRLKPANVCLFRGSPTDIILDKASV